MRIGIDIRPLQTGHRQRGIGVYLKNLLEQFSIIDRENDYDFYLCKDIPVPDLGFMPLGFKKRLVPLPLPAAPSALWRLYYQQLQVPWQIRAFSPGVFHFSEFEVPLWRPFNSVVTIHDIIPLKLIKETFGQGNPYFLRKFALKQGNIRIIAPSASTKHDLAVDLGADEGKITVVPMGVNACFSLFSRRQKQQAMLKFGLPEKFILYVGGLDYNKNIPGLIAAWKAVQRINAQIYLVIVAAGAGLVNFNHLAALVKDDAAAQRIKLIDYIDDPLELAGIYNCAEVYVSATFYEGFGLPFLEAMSCGLPIVSFSNSSIPEVVAGAGLLVADRKVNDLSEGILKVLECESLRQSLAQKGLERAKLFSWEKTARATLDVYRQALGS